MQDEGSNPSASTKDKDEERRAKGKVATVCASLGDEHGGDYAPAGGPEGGAALIPE